MFVEETYIGIRGLKGVIVLFIKATTGAFEPRNIEKNVEELAEDAVFVAIAEEDNNTQEYNEIDGYKRDNPGGKEVGIKEEEEYTAKGPKDEMAVDVHHAVEGDGGYGTRGTDVFGEFHDAIWSTSETKRGNGSKAKGADSEF